MKNLSQPNKRKTQTEKLNPKILVTGNFGPKDLQIRIKKSNREVNPLIESELDQIWQNIKNKSKQAGKKCYDGTLYRLNNIIIQPKISEPRERERERERESCAQ